MAQYGLDNIRNLALLAHNGAGKTSLAEAILFNTKIINRLGKVSEGSTTSDYDPAEQKRAMSINLSMLPYIWQGNKINLMDTPGYPDFIGEVKSAIRVSEGAVIVVCAASGVEVGTEQVWAYCDTVNLARIVYINRMDRENVDFTKVVDQIQSKFGRKCLPIQLPIGEHTTFQGVIDLLKMKSYTGAVSKEGEVPAELLNEAKSLREKTDRIDCRNGRRPAGKIPRRGRTQSGRIDQSLDQGCSSRQTDTDYGRRRFAEYRRAAFNGRHCKLSAASERPSG